MSGRVGIIEHVFVGTGVCIGGPVEEQERTYICIDLKTFYASVECVDRGLDPLTTRLVVADATRGRTTICLAVTQAMKDAGVRNRCRLFEIPDGIDYIKAMPRMRHYMEVSAKIYGIYLEYVSPQDVHVYSIDECFIDATPYLNLYHMDARGFAEMLRDEVLGRTGITATVGVGPNLFQAKVALDITAKHVPGRIGILDDETFRAQIWPHRPITDIWGIGPGIAARLERHGVYDLMGVAALDENILYDELGVNAEYLIDHAFGREPCTIADIQAYRPQATSTTTGQVLSKGYPYEQAYTVLREMVDTAVLDLVDKQVVCDTISLFVGYASERAELRRLDASGTAQYVDGCGKLRSSTSGTVPEARRPRARTACTQGRRARRPPPTRARGAGDRRHLHRRARGPPPRRLRGAVRALQRLEKTPRAHELLQEDHGLFRRALGRDRRPQTSHQTHQPRVRQPPARGVRDRRPLQR